MDTVKLISEAVEEVEYITEEKDDGGKNYKIRGIFMQADIKNRNGRIYPMEVLDEEVRNYNKKFIQQNQAIMAAQKAAISKATFVGNRLGGGY